MDPAGAFSSEETLVVNNVYQELFIYNYTSTATLVPVLATQYSSNPTATSYNFVLQPNAYFMNGDAFNASVVWFNFYRVMVMNQIGGSFFSSLLYNATSAFSSGYVLPTGADAALVAGGYQLSTTNSTLRQIQASTDLAALLSHFNPSNSTIQKIMSYSNQSVVAVNNTDVQFNLINPYLNFIDAVASTAGGQVDPAFVDANGGVQPNAQNTFVNTHSMATGPYTIQNFQTGEFTTLGANPNYWASKLPAGQQNVMLTSPKIPVISIQYAQSASQVIEGLKSNQGAIMGGPPIPVLPAVDLPQLASVPGLEVMSFPKAETYSFLVAELDTQKYPTNITDFRQAVVHAINYSEIISSVAAGYGQQMLGPISPGLPYYNPDNLSNYNFNTNLAISDLTAAGFKVTLPNGTTLNSSGQTIPTIPIVYWSSDPSETKAAQELQIMLTNVGIPVQLNGETSATANSDVSQAGTASGYPNIFMWYWYPSYFDPVLQDMVVEENVNYGGVFGNIAWFNDTTVNNLTNMLPFETNQSQILDGVKQVYNITDTQAPYAWLYAVTPYWVQRSYLAGVFYNPALEGFYFPTMYYNTSS